MTLRVGDILELLKELAPFPLAEEWDNVGLQLGDPQKDVRRILVALDPTLENIKQAGDQNIDLLITHHPLIFKPLKRINSETPEGRRLTSALLAGLAIISLHTNLDQIPQGVSYALARAMGLENLQVLVPGEKAEACKLVVFIPKGYEERVKKALFVGLPSEINDRLACSFGVLGEATFFIPPEGGGHEVLSRAAQWRLETVVPKAFVPLILETLKRVHPYERPIYDIYPLEARSSHIGYGYLGELKRETSLEDLISHIFQALEPSGLKVLQARESVRKVAVCGGSGSALVPLAAARGAHCLITGEIKHSDALLARELGLSLIDAGHFETERPVVSLLAAYLREKLAGEDIDILEATWERGPFQYYSREGG